MSTTVDQRVVEMRFDNSQFERAVGDTQRTLKNFKSDLNFEKDASKFGKLGEAVDSIKVKFSYLQVAAITAIQEITRRAMAAGEQLVKSLSVDQVSAGWNKYAEKTSSIQTIMAATQGKLTTEVERFNEELGTTEKLMVTINKENADLYGFDMEEEQLKAVNEQMERLIWFTDETSHNYTDMVSNIGKFTSVGVGLQDAVDAMQGIATWASLSGANIQQTSRVMYNLSQAMGTGKVRVIDWASIENANMATEEFKEMVIKTALKKKTLDVDSDGIVFAPNTSRGVEVNTKNFRDTLSEDWFTSEVLTETLKEYGEFASKVSETYDTLGGKVLTSEIVRDVGEYQEAAGDAAKQQEILNNILIKAGKAGDEAAYKELKEQMDELAKSEYDLGRKAFKAAQEAKTFAEVIQATKDAVSSKWMASFEYIFGNYNQAKELWTSLAETLYDLFAAGGDERNEVLAAWADLGGTKDVRDALLDIVGIVRDIVTIFKSAFDDFFFPETMVDDLEEGSKKVKTFAEILKGFTERIRDFFANLRLYEKDEKGNITAKLTERGQKLYDIFQGLFKIGKSIKKVFDAFWKIIKSIATTIKDTINRLIEVTNAKRFFKNMFGGKDENGLIKEFSAVNIFEWIADKLTAFAQWLSNSKTIEFITNCVETFITFIWDLPSKFEKAFKELTGYSVGEALQGLWDGVKDAFNWMKDNHVLESIWEMISGFFGTVRDLLFKITNTGSFGELFDKVKGVFSSIFGFFTNLFGGGKNNGTEGWRTAEEAEEAATKTGGHMSSAFSGITRVMAPSKIEKNLKPLTQTLDETGRELEGATTSVGNFAEKATGFFDVLKNVFSMVFGALQDAFEKLAPYMSDFTVGVGKALLDIIEGLLTGLADLIKAADFSKLLTDPYVLLKALAVAKFIMDSIVALQFAAAYKNFADGIESFGDAMYVRQKANRTKAVAEVIKSIAILAGVLAAAAFVFSRMNDEQLKRGLIGIGVIFGLIIVMLVLIKALFLKQKKQKVGTLEQAKIITRETYNQTSALRAVSFFLIALGAAVALITKSIVSLSSVAEDPNRFWRSAAVVLGIIALLGVFIAVLAALFSRKEKSVSKKWLKLSSAAGVDAGGLGENNSFKSNSAANIAQFLGAAVMLIAIAAAVKSIAKTVAMLSGYDPNTLGLSFAVVAGILAALLITMGVIVVASRNVSTKDMLGIAALLAIVSAVIFLLSYVLERILPIAKDESGWKAVEMFAVIVGTLTVAVGALAVLGKFVSATNATAVLSIAALVVAMGAVAVALGWALSMVVEATKNDPGGVAFGRFMAILVVASALLALLVAVSSIAGPLNILAVAATFVSMGVMAVALAYSLQLMIPVIDYLSKLDTSAIKQALLTILGIFAVFAAGGVLISVALPGLAGFVLVLTGLAVAGLIFAAAAWLIAEAVEKLSTTFIKFCKDVNDNSSTIISAFKVMANAFVEGLLTVIRRIPDILGELFSAILAILPDLRELVIQIIRDTLTVIWSMSGEITETVVHLTIQMISALTKVLPTFFEFLTEFGHQLHGWVMERLPEWVETVVTFITLLSEHTEELATAFMNVIVGIIRGINNKIDELVTELLSLIQGILGALEMNISTLIDIFAGAIILLVKGTVGAFLKGIMGSLGEALSEFAKTGSDFFDILDEIDPRTLEAVKMLSDMIMTLTGAALLEGLAKLLNLGESPLTKFGKQLAELAPYLVTFAQNTSSINAEQLESVSRAGKMLAELANSLPKLDGVMQKFTGTPMSMEEFGKQLEEFGKAFAKFYDSIKDVKVDKDKVEQVASAGKIMAGLYNNLPKIGGLMQKLTGETMSMSEFGNQLQAFGASFVLFYNTIKNVEVDTKKVETVRNVARMFAGLYTYLPNMGGLVQKMFGEKMSLDQFGSDLHKFAIGFLNFHNVIKNVDINDKNVQIVERVAKTFAAIYDHLPNLGGVMDLFTGTPMTLKDFGKDLLEFAKAFKKFNDGMKDVDIDDAKLQVVERVAKTFAALYDHLPEMPSLMDKLVGKNKMNLKDFGDDLENFAKGFKKFAEELEDVSVSQDTIDMTVRIAEVFSKLESNLPVMPNLMDKIFGENRQSLGDFGDNMADFGYGISEFATSVAGISVKDSELKNVTKIADELMQLETKLPNMPNFMDKIFGENKQSLGDFGNQMGSFATGFASFANAAAGITATDAQMDMIVTVTEDFVKIYQTINGENGSMWNAIVGFVQNITGQGGPLTKFGKELENLGSSLGQYVKNITTNGTTLTSFTSWVGLTERALTAFRGITSNDVTNLKNYKDAIKNFATTLGSNDVQNSVERVGTYITTTMGNGMYSEAMNTNGSFRQALGRLLSSLSTYFADPVTMATLRNIGENIVQGLVTGVESTSSQQAVATAAVTMAGVFTGNVQNRLETHSPSRVMYGIGKNVIEGFVNGIDNYLSDVNESGQSIVESTLDGVNQAISKAEDYVTDDLDDAFVLKPILDLSEIQNGTNQIGGMMNAINGYEISGSADYARALSIRETDPLRAETNATMDRLSSAIEDMITNPQNGNFENTFNITGADPRAIAEEVAAILQRQVERRQAVWG